MLRAVAHQDWTLTWWDWWFLLEWWQTMLVAVVITPLEVWWIRWVVQGMWVNPFTHDWMSFNFDVFLGVGIGAMIWLAHDMPAGSGYAHGVWYGLLNYGLVVFWFGFAMFKWWDERHEVQTWSRRLGATSLYHVLVLVYLGPLYTILFVNTLDASWSASPQHVVAHVVSIFVVVAWLFAGLVLDPKFRTAPDGRSKFEYTSPHDGWRIFRILSGRPRL